MKKKTNNLNDIEKVICYDDDLINNIKIKKIDETHTKEIEQLLLEKGYKLPEKEIISHNDKKVIRVLTWESLLKEANEVDHKDINSIFSGDELKKQKEALDKYEKEFNQIHKLDKYDISISVFSGIVGALVDIILVGIPEKTPNGLSAGELSNRVRDFFDKKFPEEEMQKLADSKISKVPYDAQDNRNTKIYVDGLSSYYHRAVSLGHDPFLGLVFGVKDIMNGTMTTIDKKGKYVVQSITEYQDRKETNIFKAITKQFIHFASDVNTSAGLPAPLTSLFNLLQVGNIGTEEQTVAEIVQGMYYSGYDFVHFCSLSIPVMIEEVITRLFYFLKKIKEGNSIKDSIPFSLDRAKNPKLSTMLFLSHSTASAINVGKVMFTKNPMAINYPEWMAFFTYSYKQLKWVIIEKPDMRDKYLIDKLDKELDNIIDEINNNYNELTKDAIIVIE